MFWDLIQALMTGLWENYVVSGNGTMLWDSSDGTMLWDSSEENRLWDSGNNIVLELCCLTT